MLSLLGWRSRPISRVLSWTVIPLGASSPIRSSSLPGPDAGSAIRSLFGLAPGGVCRAGLLPDSRCALTAPFHPCHAPCLRLRRCGGTWPDLRPAVPSQRQGRSAVCSLLHFPSARAAQALPGTVPCGARTFLDTVADAATVWPTPPAHCTRTTTLPRSAGDARSAEHVYAAARHSFRTDKSLHPNKAIDTCLEGGQNPLRNPIKTGGGTGPLMPGQPTGCKSCLVPNPAAGAQRLPEDGSPAAFF